MPKKSKEQQVKVVLEQAVPERVPRDERQYAAQLRRHVLATSDPDITEAQIKEKIEGINHAAELYEIGPAEQACLYKYVWDKGLLGVGQATYGELLNEFFEDCDVADKFGHQKKLKTKLSNVVKARADFFKMMQLTEVDEMALRFKSLLKEFAAMEGGNEALQKAGIELDDGAEEDEDEG